MPQMVIYIYIYLAKSFNANRPCSATIAVLSDASNCASLNASSPIFSNRLANNLQIWLRCQWLGKDCIIFRHLSKPLDNWTRLTPQQLSEAF